MTTERKWEAQWARVSGQKELSTDQVDLGYSRGVQGSVECVSMKLRRADKARHKD